jgi:poly(hydroxyalkanoate) depolymerase family esterase
MNDKMLAGMLEATRQTRAGRLNEATATIQRVLRSGYAPDAANAPSEPAADAPIEGQFRVIETSSTAPTRADVAEAPAPKRPSQGVGHPRWRGFALPAARPRPAPVHAPDVIPEGGRFITGSYTNHAGTRSYKLYIPSSYRGQALPLVVMLHGCTQNPDDFAAGTRMNRIAEEQCCFVLYPAQAQGANIQKCWNWFQASDQRRDQGEPSLIAGMTREIVATHAIDSQRIYVAGLSAGGAMAAIMGNTYPDLYAAVGVHSGLAPGAAHDLPSAYAAMQGAAKPAGPRRSVPGRAVPQARAVPVIVFHGDRDTLVHPRNGEQVIARCASADACPRQSTEPKPRVTAQRGEVPNGHAYTRATYHDAHGRPTMEQWLIHGGGHAWAGGSPSGSYTDPKGPDATREMLRFFYEHPMAGHRPSPAVSPPRNGAAEP